MIDTHCHLDYLDDPAAARGELGLTGMVCIGADLEHARNAIDLATRFDDVWATVGLHPTEAGHDTAETRAELQQLSEHPRVVGIGETGLDYYWDAATPEQQRSAFHWQLELASHQAKPVIIHTRDKAGRDEASRECAAILTAAGWERGILHCFNGHPALLRAGLDLGFYVSFAGNVTYKNAQEIREAARLVPRNRLLVETDAPFLAPVPKRGKPNRPGYVRYTLQFLAEWLNVDEAELERVTDENARRAYGLSLS